MFSTCNKDVFSYRSTFRCQHIKICFKYIEYSSPESTKEFCTTLINDEEEAMGVLFSFDGASRGNPGQASHGNCAWWGSWRQGAFKEAGVLFRKGVNLGVQTNNVAEVRGLAFAAKAALHWHFWMLELCSHIAARRAY